MENEKETIDLTGIANVEDETLTVKKGKFDESNSCIEIEVPNEFKNLIIENAEVDGNRLILKDPRYSVKDGNLVIDCNVK